MEHVCQASREMSSTEKYYWQMVDNGDNPVPPTPCRECGLVWVHDPKCVLEIYKTYLKGYRKP